MGTGTRKIKIPKLPKFQKPRGCAGRGCRISFVSRRPWACLKGKRVSEPPDPGSPRRPGNGGFPCHPQPQPQLILQKACARPSAVKGGSSHGCSLRFPSLPHLQWESLATSHHLLQVPAFPPFTAAFQAESFSKDRPLTGVGEGSVFPRKGLPSSARRSRGRATPHFLQPPSRAPLGSLRPPYPPAPKRPVT